jgi:hypothetical protein
MDTLIKMLDRTSLATNAISRRLNEYRISLTCQKFVTRPDDIFIVTYPKSGTSWVQMILYQILTDGNMDFQHISEHSPFFEADIAYRKDFKKFASPRIFKTHLRYHQMPKSPCKKIYISRNGRDVAVSYFHHQQTHGNFKGDFSKFFEMFLKGEVLFGSWFKHTGEWLAHRDDPSVLFLTYEGLSKDLEGSVKKILNFCEREVEPDHLKRILERASFDYMRQYEGKFNPHTLFELSRVRQTNSFIRKGKVGGWKNYFTSEQEAAFDRLRAKHAVKLADDSMPT